MPTVTSQIRRHPPTSRNPHQTSRLDRLSIRSRPLSCGGNRIRVGVTLGATWVLFQGATPNAADLSRSGKRCRAGPRSICSTGTIPAGDTNGSRRYSGYPGGDGLQENAILADANAQPRLGIRDGAPRQSQFTSNDCRLTGTLELPRSTSAARASVMPVKVRRSPGTKLKSVRPEALR